MYRELDRVALKKAKPQHQLNQGAVGSIIKVHPRSAGYEVEFVAPNGQPPKVVSLKTSDIRTAD